MGNYNDDMVDALSKAIQDDFDRDLIQSMKEKALKEESEHQKGIEELFNEEYDEEYEEDK